VIQRLLAYWRTISRLSLWSAPPRLPMKVPRAATDISCPSGVTRFCSGITKASGGPKGQSRSCRSMITVALFVLADIPTSSQVHHVTSAHILLSRTMVTPPRQHSAFVSGRILVEDMAIARLEGGVGLNSCALQ
jgi:hypothetical protein